MPTANSSSQRYPARKVDFMSISPNMMPRPTLSLDQNLRWCVQPIANEHWVVVSSGRNACDRSLTWIRSFKPSMSFPIPIRATPSSLLLRCKFMYVHTLPRPALPQTYLSQHACHPLRRSPHSDGLNPLLPLMDLISRSPKLSNAEKQEANSVDRILNIIAYVGRCQENLPRGVKFKLKNLESSHWAIDSLHLDLAFMPGTRTTEILLQSASRLAR